MTKEKDYDKTVADTFPASDPPANSGITGAEPSSRAGEPPADKRDPRGQPTGTPTSDRRATETEVTGESETKPKS